MNVALDILLKSTMVLAATAILGLALRHRTAAAVRHAAWMTGLTAALCVPMLGALMPGWKVPMLPVVQGAPAPSDTLGEAPAGTDRHVPALLQDGAIETGMAASSLAAGEDINGVASLPVGVVGWSRAQLTPLALVTIAWAVGTLLLLGRLLIAAHVARRMASTHLPGPAPWLVTARHLARAMGVTRHVRFVRSPRVTMPMACGVLRPAVVLPVDVDGWPESRATAVLLHELAHVRRHDCLTQALADLVVALYWFNPLAWLAVRALRRERERACDDMVLAAGTPAPEYASHLLDVARAARRPFPFGISPGVAMAHRSELEGRLMAILDDTLPRRGITTRAALVTTALVIAVAVPLAALDPWSAPDTQAGPLAGAGQSPAASAAPLPAMAPRVQPTLDDAVDEVPADDAVTGQATAAATPAQTPTPVVEPGRSDQDDEPSSQQRQADPKVVAALIGVLTDEDADVRMQAAHALSRQHHSDAQKAIAGMINDKDEDLRQLAIMSLARMGDPASFDPLVAALKDANPSIRQQAAFGLSHLQDARAAAPLAAALKDADASVRQQAAFALGRLRSRESVDALIAAARDAAADVRQQALWALGHIGDARAQDLAIALLQDADADVRGMAVFTLMRLGERP